MRKLFIATCLSALLIASGSATAAEGGSSGGFQQLLVLLQKKGLASAEEVAALREQASGGESSPAVVKAVMDLLRSKGLINEEEAGSFLAAAATPGSEDAPDEDAEPENALPYDVDMLKGKLHLVLWKQGVLGTFEEEQIAERIGKKWDPAGEDDVIAPAEGEIEYHRTTLPKETLLADIDELTGFNLITKEEAERIKERFARKLALEQVTDDIRTDLLKELDKQVAEKLIPVPEWAKRIKIAGDLRLRYQADFFDGDGGYDSGNGIFVKPDKPTELYNSTIDRHQFRIRARLAFLAKVNDDVEAGLGLATGNTTNPVSTNVTLGDSLNKKNFLLDQAYMKWTPDKSLTLWGGRFPNPWFSTDLVWDPDINFDGAAFSYKPQLTSTLSLFLTGGAFPIQEIELSGHDKWLYAGQLGLRYQDEKRLTATLAAAFYDFENMTGRANDPAKPNANDWTAPLFQQKGNTLFDIDPSPSIKTAYAAEFRELNIGGSLDIGFWDPLRVVLFADYVNNIGYDSASVNALTGHDVKKETEGYQFGLSVGHADTRAPGQWKMLVNYKYLEADAVVDAFTDSDFHLGGTNAKGWIVGGDLGVGRNVWLSTRWLTSNEISGPPLAIDVFQFNVNARF